MSRLPSVQPAAVYPTINRPLRFAAQPGGLPSLEVRGARRRQTHSRVAAVAVVRPPAWIKRLFSSTHSSSGTRSTSSFAGQVVQCAPHYVDLADVETGTDAQAHLDGANQMINLVVNA